MGIVDIFILVLLTVAAGFALRAIRRGKGRCGGDCAKCAGCRHGGPREEPRQDIHEEAPREPRERE